MRNWAYRNGMLAALGAALLSGLSGAAHAAPVYGDADGNGVVNLADAKLLLQVAGGIAPNNATIRRNGDVGPVNNYNAGSFGDGKITLADAIGVARHVEGTDTGEFPAKSNVYVLEVGNTLTVRKYDSTGTATTGPGAANPDVTQTIDHTQQETVGGKTYTAFVIKGTDAGEEHVANDTDTQNRPDIVLLQGPISGTQVSFNPPLELVAYPVQAGTTWSGTTSFPYATGFGTFTATATYNGSVIGTDPVTTPAGTFDNAQKVALTYTAKVFGSTVATGEEDYWFVPFIGPVQHSFSRNGGAFTTDIKLVSANIHGVTYP